MTTRDDRRGFRALMKNLALIDTDMERFRARQGRIWRAIAATGTDRATLGALDAWRAAGAPR